MAAMMRMMATTMSNSMSENPCWFFGFMGSLTRDSIYALPTLEESIRGAIHLEFWIIPCLLNWNNTLDLSD